MRVPRSGEEAAALVIEMIEKHLNHEEQVAISMAFVFSKPENVLKIFQRLFADQVLPEAEFVQRLRTIPGELRLMELPS